MGALEAFEASSSHGNMGTVSSAGAAEVDAVQVVSQCIHEQAAGQERVFVLSSNGRSSRLLKVFEQGSEAGMGVSCATQGEARGLLMDAAGVPSLELVPAAEWQHMELALSGLRAEQILGRAAEHACRMCGESECAFVAFRHSGRG